MYSLWKIIAPVLPSSNCNAVVAARSLLRSPWTSILCVLSIALGIATNSSIVAIRSMLYSPLPYLEPNRLVAIEEIHEKGYRGVCMSDFLDWGEQSSAFESMALTDFVTFTVINPNHENSQGDAERVNGRRVSVKFFSTLGAQPSLGRWLVPDDFTSARDVAVISHSIWVRRFGASTKAIGQSLLIDGSLFTVVGVMPETFRPYETGEEGESDIWVPMALRFTSREQHQFRAIARLAAGTTVSVAQNQLSTITERILNPHPETKGWRARVEPLQAEGAPAARPVLNQLSLAAGIILLIVCANVSNVLAARGVNRRHEVGVKLAMGASRIRISLQLLTESILIAIIGAMVGIAMAVVCLKSISALLPETNSLRWALSMNSAAILLTVLISLVCGVAFGYLPVWTCISANPIETFRTSPFGGSREGHGRGARLAPLLVFEVASALVLLVATLLAMSGFNELAKIDLGFEPAGLTTMKLDVPVEACSALHECSAFYPALMQRISALPDVISVAADTAPPFSGIRAGWNTDIEKETNVAADWANRMTMWHSVTAGYFKTMKIELIAGRAFEESDTANSEPVAIVNESAARRFWPDGGAIGKRVRILDGPWRRVIGVVRDVRANGAAQAADLSTYLPFSQHPDPSMFLIIRTSSEVALTSTTIRNIVKEQDGAVPVSRFTRMSTLVSDSLWRFRVASVIMSIFGVIAITFTVVGLYGVVSYSTARRTKEIALRMAVGASPSAIVRLVLARGLVMIAAGEAIGFISILTLQPVAHTYLQGLPLWSFSAVAEAALVILVAGVLACYVPSRKAAAMNPCSALRLE